MPPDQHLPSAQAKPPARRGGARPGAGAPKGNQNAHIHGLYATRPPADPAAPPAIDLIAVARRLQAQQQRQAERIAAALARMALHARHLRDRITAVESGTPLPPPPLLPVRREDFALIQEFARPLVQATRDERDRRNGLLTAGDPELEDDRDTAVDIDTLIHFGVAALDRALAHDQPTTALATYLETSYLDQPATPLPPSEATDHSPAPAAKPAPSTDQSNNQSIKPPLPIPNHFSISDTTRTPAPPLSAPLSRIRERGRG